MLAAFIGSTAQVKPVNGRNPLVQAAARISLPMPYEDEFISDYDDEDYEMSEDMELREPLSEDEQFNGVNQPPRDYSHVKPPRRRRRLPPMPRTPDIDQQDQDEWVPPFEVLPDGTVTGPKVGDADPTRLPEGFDPPKGSFEGVAQIFTPPGSR